MQQVPAPAEEIDDSTEHKTQEIDVSITCQTYVNDMSMTKTENVNTEEDKEKDNNKIHEQVALLWSLYPRKKGKARATKLLPTLIKKHGVEQLRRCIDRLTEDVKDEQFYPHGSTFFQGRFMDYLDSNYLDSVADNLTSRWQYVTDPVTGEQTLVEINEKGEKNDSRSE